MKPRGRVRDLLVDARREMNRWEEKRNVVAKMNKKMKHFKLMTLSLILSDHTLSFLPAMS